MKRFNTFGEINQVINLVFAKILFKINYLHIHNKYCILLTVEYRMSF